MRKLIVLLLFACSYSSFGQKCRVKFIVIDNYTKQRVPGVRVVHNSSTTCNTDAKGECVSQELDKGDQYFTFEKTGYETLENYLIYAVPDTTLTEPSIELARETYTRSELAAAVQAFASQNRTWIQQGDRATLAKIYDTSLVRFMNETLVLQYERNNNRRGLSEYQVFADTLFRSNRIGFIRRQDRID